MKKLLVCGVLGLMALPFTAQNAFAWGWLKNKCCCSKYCTTLNIKPYNAFSPVAYGTIVADGCMPFSMYGGQLPAQWPNGYPGGYPGGYGCPTGGCASGYGCGAEVGGMPQGGYIASMPMQYQQAQPVFINNPGMQFVNPGMQTVSPGMEMVPGVQMINPGAQFVAPGGQFINQSSFMGNGQMVPANVNVQPVGFQAPAQAPAYWFNNR